MTDAKKPQLPIKTPFELTLESEMNVEIQRFNNGWLFKWYGMTYEGGKTDVEDFRGGRISYAGTKFGHQQQQVFWQAIDRYLDQKVHETFKQWEAEMRALPDEVRLRSIDGVERTLRRFVVRIISDGKETDRRLRGNGFPDRVQPVDDSVASVYTMAEISNLATSHRMLLQHIIERARQPEPAKVLKLKWLEDLYAENKGLIKLLGAGAVAVWGYFYH